MIQINNSGCLYIFNLSTDLDNEILAFTHDWIEEFSHHFEKIHVYSTHLGRTNLPSNVFTHELGGGNFRVRVMAVFEIFSALNQIVFTSKNRFVFYHMNPRVASIISLPLRIIKVPQILWYSHANTTFALRIASKFVDSIVSTSTFSFPLNTRKLTSTGHGVRDLNIPRPNQIIPDYSISFLGRISPIKRLELLIQQVSIAQNFQNLRIKVYFIGPCEGSLNQHYRSTLLELAGTEDVEVIFVGSILHENIQLELSKYDLAYNGTIQSIDKGAIESVYARCLLISDQKNTLIECGYGDLFIDEYGEALSISQQLKLIYSLSHEQRIALTEDARIKTLSRHSLPSTIDKICKEFSRIMGLQ